MARREPDFTGDKGVSKALAEGKDPNADLKNAKPETKAQAALTLAVAGTSWTRIAEMLGYSSAYRARQAVERVLASAADSPLEREKMRVLFDKRLNRLLQATMGKAVDPNDPEQLAYVSKALAIIDRQARLWGVDAPTQIQFTPTDQRIQEMVQHMLAVSGGGDQAIEAEIVDEETHAAASGIPDTTEDEADG